MGASESKTDSIDVDVDVADAPADKTPAPINSTLSEADTSAEVAPFCKAIKAGAELAALDRIKDNLGHPRPPRTDSTLYADKVGKEFASKQPEHEVTAADATELGALGVAPGVGPVYH